MNFRCYNILEIVLEEADSRFAPFFRPDEDRLREIEARCDELDRLMEANGGEEFSCEVDEETLEILLSVTLSDLIVEPGNDGFLWLTKGATEVKINWEHEEGIRVSFLFPGVWVRA